MQPVKTGKVLIQATNGTVLASVDPVLTSGPKGENVDVEATMAKVKDAIAAAESVYCWRIKVGQGKTARFVGHNGNIGLSHRQAIVLFQELVSMARDTMGRAPSSLRYQDIGMYQRLSSGEMVPVSDCQYTGANRILEAKMNAKRQGRWVK